MKSTKRAQALVEFALIFPLLMAFLLALIDAAFLFQGYLTVNHAAREAVRFAAVYRPNQGECLNHDEFGTPILEPYPYCPRHEEEDPNESETHYHERRVELIKLAAMDAMVGLRVSTECVNNNCIQDRWIESGMAGVRVWGFQSFETTEEEDMPGLPGLPVRVMVMHNVPLVVFGSILPDSMVRVTSSAEMINEGIQVGWGNEAVPSFAPVSGQYPPGTALPTEPPSTEPPPPTAGSPLPPTVTPLYHIDLTPANALNGLPDERAHMLIASVTDDMGRAVAGARVTFSTDAGSFAPSGIGEMLTVGTTGSDGNARVVIYANEPMTARIQAWLDYNYNQAIDSGEPSDTATKVWEVAGPYLVLSDHNPAPTEWISVWVEDHPVSQMPFSLWWCPAAITSTHVVAPLGYPINVDANGDGDPDGIAVAVPAGVAGVYRIESHAGSGGADGCAETSSLQAYSALIEIAEVPPDLVIEDVAFVDDEPILPGEPITLSIMVRNDSAAPVTTGPFDLDTYLDLVTEPQLQQLGETKQWLDNLDAFASTVITTVVTVYTAEDHELWLQVDTTNYVDEGTEGGEDNNVYGPVLIEVLDCIPMLEVSDDFDGGMSAPWTAVNVGGSWYRDADGSYSISSGQLEVTSRGSSIGNGDLNYYLIYQPISGDFDARLRIIQESQPNTDDLAKIGLIAVDRIDEDSLYAANMATRTRSPAAEQGIYRTYSGGNARYVGGSDDNRLSLPTWLRLRRIGSTFNWYYSNAAIPRDDDWTSQGSATVSGLGYLGIAHASYDDRAKGTAIVDEFEVCRPTDLDDITPPPVVIHPPGLVQCTELVTAQGFEGNPATVYDRWVAGESSGLTGGYQRTSQEFYRGSFSMRLHASNSVIPCDANQLQPYVYQVVQMPTEVYTHSTLTVQGQYHVAGSVFECSVADMPDTDDKLSISLREVNGQQIVAPQEIINGSAQVSETIGTRSRPVWHQRTVELHPLIDEISAYQGQELRLQWEAYNDADIWGTFFYMDDVSAQLCTSWPVPDTEAGTATVGGLITTRGENNVPTPMPGTDVWAYTQGVDVLHTRAIHDGTYHFYNVTPGTYIIYAEAWVGGELRTVSTSVTVEADDRRADVNLLLQ